MTKARQLWKRLKARFPEDLPRTPASLDAFAVDTLTTYGFPATNDYKRAVLKALHALTQATHRAPKFYFYTHLARFEAMRAAVIRITEIEREDKQAATPLAEEPLIDGKEANPQSPAG